jgi:hypothetical protein
VYGTDQVPGERSSPTPGSPSDTPRVNLAFHFQKIGHFVMAKKLDLSNIDELLAESKALLNKTKGKMCRRCKKMKQLVQSGFCQECWLETTAEKEKRRLESRFVDPETKSVRMYHPDSGKLVYEHRYLMEQHLGRPLESYEAVIWRDGNRQNNDLSNLLLSFKNGTPLENLVCDHCQTRGKFTFVSAPTPQPS